jgi:hypothetical protein
MPHNYYREQFDRETPDNQTASTHSGPDAPTVHQAELLRCTPHHGQAFFAAQYPEKHNKSLNINHISYWHDSCLTLLDPSSRSGQNMTLKPDRQSTLNL